MEEKILKVKNISKKFYTGDREDFSIKNLSFDMTKGEVICLVGPSGSGKSSILRLIAGLESPDRGSIEYSCDKKKIVFVSQDYNLWPHKTVFQNIKLALKEVYRLSDKEIESRCIRLLEQFDLYDKKDSYPNSLSGGQQQRVAIIRAMAVQPEIFLFDEITSALDPLLIDGVLDVIKVLAKNNNSIIIVTHEIRFATEIADRIFFIKNGEVIQQAHPTDFIHNQEEDFIKNFIKNLDLEKQDVKVHKGFDQFQSFQLGTLKRFKVGSSKNVVGSSGDKWFECMGDYYEEYEKNRIAKKISWNMIMQEEAGLDKDLRLRFPDLNQYKILPKNMQNPANYYVIEDTVVIQIFKTEDNEPMIIEIKNKEVAESYKKYFDLLWSISEDIQ